MQRIDFNNCLDAHSMKIRKFIPYAFDFILSDRTMTLRRAAKELNVPRRTLCMYLLDYSLLLDESWPDFNEYGEQINYADLRYSLERRIRYNKQMYQNKH